MTPKYYFYARTAEKILSADQAGKHEVRVSLDLNISVATWKIQDHCLIIGGEHLPVSDLETVAGDKNKVFGWDGSQINPIEVRTDGYYKLVPTDTVPTLEINGVKMHRSKDIAPLEDARLKTGLVVRPGSCVLDTCGGLGYSALFAVKAGARAVVSTEKSPAVMEIREQNPWLQPGAFDWFTPEAAGRITLNPGDVTRIITTLPDAGFDAVIHDPPRFTSATGDLYGRVFYEQLARVMQDGGRLFHYTGSPKKIVHQDRFIQNAMKRLGAAGFGNISFNQRLQGIYAEKNKRIFP